MDRSLVNEEYNQDRAQGVQLAYLGDQIRLMGAITDGFGSDNVPALAEDIEGVAVTGRAEFLADGTWRQFRDFTSWQGEDSGLLIGAAVHYEREESGTPAGPEERLFTWTADASAEFGGANVFGAVISRHLDEAS